MKPELAMTEERIALIENRLNRMEQMVTGIDARLRRIENPGARETVSAPPVIWPQQPAVPPVAPQAPTPPVAPPARPVMSPVASAPSAPSPARPDAEYRIGAQVLPRIGAVMLLLGVGYLIALGLAGGWITPQMLFGGTVALCLGFVGVGQWKREEREEFGQILTGIGSCGLYLTFAGGHVFQKLYSGETLVGLFMVLSFVNLGYSAWRASRSFLAIGLIGGLAAALMPLDRLNFNLNLGLHFAILVPCALIAARHKWKDIAAWLWLVSSLALLPVLFVAGFNWQLRVLALDLSTLLCVGAYSIAYRKHDFDPTNAAPIVAIAFTALGSFAIHSGLSGAAHLLLFSAALGLSGLAFPAKSDQRNSLLTAAIGVATMLAPFGPEPWVACLILSGCAVGYALLGGYLKNSAWAAGGAVVLGLGCFAYLLSLYPHVQPLGIELAALAGLMGATCALAWSGTRVGGASDSLMTVAAAVCLPFLVRTVESVLVLPSFGLTFDFAIAVGLAVATGIVLALAFASGWGSGSKVAACFGGFTLAAYGITLLAHTLMVGADLTFLGFVVVMVALVATLESRAQANDTPIAAASAIIGLLFARICSVVFKDYTATPWFVTVPLSLCGYAVANSALARWRQWQTVHVVSGLAWLGAAGVYLARVSDLGFGFGTELTVLLTLLGSLLALALLAGRREEGSLVAFSAVTAMLLSRIGVLVLGHGSSLPWQASTILTLSVFATANSALARRNDWKALHAVSGLGLATAVLLYARTVFDLGFNVNTEAVVLVGLVSSVVAFAALAKPESEGLPFAASLVSWGLFSRLAFLWLTGPLVGMQTNAAVSLSWIVYAVILIAVGFALNIKLVRYAGLAVIGSTVGKVLLIDLAETSPGIRVGVLMALGLAMLGGGYWYIRRREVVGGKS